VDISNLLESKEGCMGQLSKCQRECAVLRKTVSAFETKSQNWKDVETDLRREIEQLEKGLSLLARKWNHYNSSEIPDLGSISSTHEKSLRNDVDLKNKSEKKKNLDSNIRSEDNVPTNANLNISSENNNDLNIESETNIDNKDFQYKIAMETLHSEKAELESLLYATQEECQRLQEESLLSYSPYEAKNILTAKQESQTQTIVSHSEDLNVEAFDSLDLSIILSDSISQLSNTENDDHAKSLVGLGSRSLKSGIFAFPDTRPEVDKSVHNIVEQSHLSSPDEHSISERLQTTSMAWPTNNPKGKSQISVFTDKHHKPIDPNLNDNRPWYPSTSPSIAITKQVSSNIDFGSEKVTKRALSSMDSKQSSSIDSGSGKVLPMPNAALSDIGFGDIECLTQMMLGCYFLKYNRSNTKTHMRFFWINPYAMTLIYSKKAGTQIQKSFVINSFQWVQTQDGSRTRNYLRNF
jgi:hypothetical protein